MTEPITPERLDEIEETAGDHPNEPGFYGSGHGVDRHTTIALCAALREAWCERDALRAKLDEIESDRRDEANHGPDGPWARRMLEAKEKNMVNRTEEPAEATVVISAKAFRDRIEPEAKP